MLDTLRQWNRWGTGTLNPGYPREITAEICHFINIPEVITIIGPRRAGKTTVLYQLIHYLEQQGINPKAILYLNFEEPAFAPKLKLELLDEIYNLYRSEIYPSGQAYLFLDEIQNVPEWERWVRARNETENIKIFVSGSSAQLMSRELATLLTGRHVLFHIYPLSFKEILRFKQIDFPNELLPNTPSAPIKHALNQYLRWGGFPRVVLSDDDLQREVLLKRYFDDLLFKDVVLRHKIRDPNALRNLAIHLLTQTASLISFKRLANMFQVSSDLAQAYCQYLQEAFLIEFAPFYSLKAAERTRNPKKIHVIDPGFRKITSLSHSADNGRVIETLVHNELLRRKNDGIFYWKQHNEIDLLIRQGNTITHLIQIAFEGLENEKVFKREVTSLLKAKNVFKEANLFLITWDLPLNWKQPKETQENIHVIPLWKFLLYPELI